MWKFQVFDSLLMQLSHTEASEDNQELWLVSFILKRSPAIGEAGLNRSLRSSHALPKRWTTDGSHRTRQ